MKNVIPFVLICCLWTPFAAASPLGQWIWTRHDWAPFEKARVGRPDLVAAMHIATLSWDAAKQDFKVDLALSPTWHQASGKNVVVRIDDKLHFGWRSSETAVIARALDRKIRRLKSFMTSSGTDVAWQLDYDAPVAALEKWAEALAFLHGPSGALYKHNLWITTLVSHILDHSFEPSMRGIIQGHILQIFDTGDDLSKAQLQAVETRLSVSRIPFAMGIAAFRRVNNHANEPTNDFDTQMEWVTKLSHQTNFRGTWVFPAGQNWSIWAAAIP